MKRCPQCDFIYEDEQSLCDMDGVLLVFDSRSLPNMHALATVDVPAASKAGHWRHRTFPAMAALILATVFSLVYFVSTTRTAPGPSAISGASAAAPVVGPAPVAESSQPASESNHAVVPVAEEPGSPMATKREEKKPESSKNSTTPSNKKASTPTTQRKPAEPKKEENKVGSILKKTGRILKKPFKF